MKGHLFIVSGPSGVGKTTLIDGFLEKHGATYNIKRCVTYTTRQPRAQEVDGEDYYFISEADFNCKISQGFFLEWSDQYIYKYGTPKNILKNIEMGTSYILIIDRVGAQKIINSCAGVSVVTVLVAVSSIDLLHERLLLRNTEEKLERDQRLKTSYDEINQEIDNKLYQFTVLNDVFQEAFAALNALFKQVFKELKKNNEKM
jgi:guanylate kinase